MDASGKFATEGAMSRLPATLHEQRRHAVINLHAAADKRLWFRQCICQTHGTRLKKVWPCMASMQKVLRILQYASRAQAFTKSEQDPFSGAVCNGPA
ncbi:hypothetical protein Pla175_29050 [Pirellulimonas nuda]|uniref:Uncharacterized protein n=1 Tax=Pirellulimonas nuda TaxID=2528009 RepID=A0A518DDI2_9BACT|nr:hypothetical protein Pla175_29050 [Pirellulimonas nuda]